MATPHPVAADRHRTETTRSEATCPPRLLTLAPRLIRSPFDGLVVGALVGLGFQISEDISYAFIGAANALGDVGAAWATIIARGTLASIPSHWMFSGLFGAGLVWFIGRPEVPARKGLGAALMATAMLMHGLWDASSAIGGGGASAWAVPTLVAAALISAFVFVYKTAVPVEQEWMRDLMAPEVELGVVTPAELDALAGSPSTLKRYLHTQRPAARRSTSQARARAGRRGQDERGGRDAGGRGRRLAAAGTSTRTGRSASRSRSRAGRCRPLR
jgi:hypothetical protein